MNALHEMNEEQLTLLATTVALDLARDRSDAELLSLKNLLSQISQTLSFLYAQRKLSPPRP